MNKNEVIKYPILTEKTYSKMDKGIYTFACSFKTNKTEIKKTVEFIFGVKVLKINIANVSKKAKKLGKFAGFTKRYKRAVIFLSDGKINLFPKEKPITKIKKNKKNETTDTELKEAKKIDTKPNKKTKKMQK